jgi:hypothetical protein
LQIDGLGTELADDGVVETAVEGDALEDGLADDQS